MNTPSSSDLADAVRDRALEADLREVLGGEAPAARAPRPDPGAVWMRAAALLLGAGVVFAIGWGLGEQAEDRAPAGGQDPAPPRVEYCADLDELATVGSDAQGLAVVGMTDGEWARLERFTELRTLALLRGTPNPGTDWDDPSVDMLSDAVWERLAAFSKLERIQVSLGGRVTGKGAAALGGLPLLRSVEIHGTRLSVEGCAALAELASVQRLHLTACGLRDDHARALAGARGVRDMALRDNLISPAGLLAVAGLPEFRALDLGGMAVTRGVLEAAVASGKLERLDLHRCRGLSAQALGTLRGAALERLEIVSTPLDAEAEAVLTSLDFEVVRR